jgi:putative transposase
LYFRFSASLRPVEEMLLERGIMVYYETVRRRTMKFGRDYVAAFKRKKASRHPGESGQLIRTRPSKGPFARSSLYGLKGSR